MLGSRFEDRNPGIHPTVGFLNFIFREGVRRSFLSWTFVPGRRSLCCLWTGARRISGRNRDHLTGLSSVCTAQNVFVHRGTGCQEWGQMNRLPRSKKMNWQKEGETWGSLYNIQPRQIFETRANNIAKFIYTMCVDTIHTHTSFKSSLSRPKADSCELYVI